MEKISKPFTLPLYFINSKSIRRSLIPFTYNRETLDLLTESSIESGKLFRNQERLIRHILDLSNITLSSLAKPCPENSVLRPEMNQNQALEALRNSYLQQPYFVYQNYKITGYISSYDLWKMSPNSLLRNYTTPITFLSPKSSGTKALKYLLTSKRQLVLVGNRGENPGYISIWMLLGKGINTFEKIK